MQQTTGKMGQATDKRQHATGNVRYATGNRRDATWEGRQIAHRMRHWGTEAGIRQQATELVQQTRSNGPQCRRRCARGNVQETTGKCVTDNRRHAACNGENATDDTQHAPGEMACHRQHADDMRHATDNMQHIIDSVQRATDNMQTTCAMQQTNMQQ